MIAHHHPQQQQPQQQQQSQSQPIEAPIRQQQQVMQQPAEGYYQQQQPAPQYAATGDGYQEQRFLPPANNNQQQQQQFVQQRTHQQQVRQQQYVPAEQFAHHRVSPQQQQQVPPPYQDATYQSQPQPQPQPQIRQQQQQQLISERRRMSPPTNNYQQQQPVRQRSMPQHVEISGQQYQQQQQQQPHNVRPQYQQQNYQQQPAFLDQEPQQQQQYQSNSPTLLQQQLSNSRQNQQQRPTYRPPVPPVQQQQYVGQPQVRRPAPVRYADEPFAPAAAGNEYSQPQQMPTPNEPVASQQAYGGSGHFAPQRAPQQQHQPHLINQPQHQPQPQVVVRRPPVHHMDQPQQQQQPPPQMLLGNPTPPLTPTSHCAPPQPAQLRQQQQVVAPAGQPLGPSDQWLPPASQHQHVQQPASRHQQVVPQPRPVMKNFPQQQYHPTHQQAPTSQFPPQQQPPRPPIVHHQQQDSGMTSTIGGGGGGQSAMRLTLPLRDTPLLGPFKLDHDAQVTSRVFHLKPHLFDSLSKSAMMNPAQATVIQELQLRAYLLQGGASSTAKHKNQHQHYSTSSQDSLLASNSNKIARNCSWPELFQLTVNGQLVHTLDTSPSGPGKAVNIFQYCHPGDNVMEIQVNDCYCSHEFVLEPVDRPTMKAFMNSCFKSRLLSQENSLRKLQYNFGSPGFLMHNHQQSTIPIINEYISEISQQQPAIEQTKVRFSLRCLLAQQINAPSQRMRTPARGHSCKHVQCFDLENFLIVNRDRSQWHCPICYLSIPFNMLELDQHQMSILRTLADNHSTDDILMDSLGQWQTYFPPPLPVAAPAPGSVMHHHPQQQPQHHHHQPQTAKSTGIYHPQAHSNQQHQQQYIPQQQPARPMSGSSMRPGVSPGSWQDVNHVTKPKQHQQHIETNGGGGQRRPASATSSMAHQQQQQQHNLSPGGEMLPQVKRICTGPPAPPQQQQQQQQPFLPAKPGPPMDQQKQYYATGNPDGATTPQQQQHHHLQHQSSPIRPTTLLTDTTADELSPLAAMERTIIQHEMGPPPFDPNSLTSTAPPATSALPKTHSGSNLVGAALNSPQATNTLAPVPGNHQPPVEGCAPTPSMIASSPVGRANSTIVAASPQHQLTPSRISDSPMQQQQPYTMSQATSISHPATPSGMLAHGGPETPATPSNSGGCNSQVIVQQTNIVHSPHVVGSQTVVANVDHQPLSNGSASAGSITSSSTMTPGSQSLGSVGMGSDSRCGTAPLQSSSSMGGLEDLMMSGSAGGNNISVAAGNSANGHRQFHGSSMDEKNEILMGKLMMDSAGGESLLHRAHHHTDGTELALALEEAEWKQQLDRGKSEHLANFLNEPMMNKPPSSHQVQKHNLQQQQHPGASKMLSGGLHPSDDENSPHGSANSPNNGQHSDHHLSDAFNNYLDCDVVDQVGAGLPPDDSILDLFER